MQISKFKPHLRTKKNIDTKKERALRWTNPFSDIDRDGVANWRDCEPFDRRKQGWKEWKEYEERFSKEYTSPEGNIKKPRRWKEINGGKDD